MGTSTDAIVCYGLDLGEGDGLPWNDPELEELELDEEDWWRGVQGYKQLIPQDELWSDEGGKVLRPDWQGAWDKQYEHQRAWDKANPMPFEVVLHCHGEYPMYIIAIPGTQKRAWRGSPVELDVNRFANGPCWDPEVYGRYEAFVREYLPTYNPDDARWWLCSYWG